MSDELPPPTGRRKQGARAFLAASAVAQLCALARYTLLARFLGPEELGLAAMVTLTSQFFQSVSDNGGDRFLIQDRDGDSPAAQKLVHVMFVGRGAFQAACLILFAGPIASYFKAPELQMALVALAIVPLISGFLHLDLRRVQRRSDFRAEGRATLAAEVLSLLATGVAAWLTRDFTAILYGLTVRSIVIVAVSHFMAERPYRLGFSREHAARLAAFSWPLMLNGLLLFVGSQGDRVVVANELGLTQLGHYTAVLMLVFYPTSMVMRFMGSMHLPLISGADEESGGRAAAADAMGGQTLLLALGVSAGFALVAPVAVVLIYGREFAQPALLTALIGIFQASRFMRQWPTTVALALGRSTIVLTNNIVRMSGLVCAVIAVRLVPGLAGVTAGFLVGELLALATAMALVNRACGHSLVHGFDRFALYILASAAILGWILVLDAPSLVSVLAALGGSVLILGWFVRRERSTLLEAIRIGRRALRVK